MLASVAEHYEAFGSGRQHEQVIQPKEHAAVLVDGRPPLDHLPEGLVLHREIGAPLFMYNNPFIHFSQRLQEFDEINVRPFPIDSLWLWPVRDVVLALPLHLVGTVHTIALLVVLEATRIRHGVAMATNGHPVLGMAKECQIRGMVEEPWSGMHRLCIHSSCVDPTSRLHKRDDKAMSPPECVSASHRARSQDVSGTLDATGQSDANGKCTHM